MQQPRLPVSPTAAIPEAHDPPSGPGSARERPNLTERVADWSARHRKTAVFGWLLLVAVLFAGGQALGSRNLPAYDAGQSGQAEQVLNKIAPTQDNPYPESVLIQATAPGATFATDPEMRQAASQVAAALAALPKDAAGIRTPLPAGGQSGGQSGGGPSSGSTALVSKDGRTALVTFDVPGNVPSVDQAATTLRHAVAGVQARHPDLRIAESGDASITQAIDASLNFGKAEATAVPVTLILLLAVFGALVAAGIPVLLALTALTATIGVVTIASHWLPVASSAFEVIVVVGMA
ncbi:MAG TPA: MMPL family transporter, partial [Trebonia sp.]|nr:MMPL family transporter [Trebonia sp.]